MNKNVMMLALMCLMAVSAKAQIYGYDQALRLPTVDLYDDAMMEMELRAARETAGRRQQAFEYYGDQAYDAYCNKKWVDVINNVNSALILAIITGNSISSEGLPMSRWAITRMRRRTTRWPRSMGCLRRMLPWCGSSRR